MTEVKEQTIYIHMDDSGVLHPNEDYCVYGGLVFLDKQKQDDFIRKYNSALGPIKCGYCQTTKDKCIRICPEIKDTNIKPHHKRRIFNLIKKEFNFAVIINNHKIKDEIMSKKDRRGRYRDYCQKRIIKLIISRLIESGEINPHLPIKLVIRIDQQGTSTDTGRLFINDIRDELVNGTYNYNYNLIFKPILFSKLDIDLKYVLSHKHLCIQASDIIAGETRRRIISNTSYLELMNELNYLDAKLFMP